MTADDIPKINLAKNLSRCGALLRRVGELFWAQKLEVALDGLKLEVSPRKLTEIISWYGGMGSFNDLLISALNGHDVDEHDQEGVNAVLDELREAIYREANALRRRNTR